MTVSGEEFGPSDTKEGRRGGFPLLPCGFDRFDLVRAAPLWKRSLSDRSYALVSLIGMTWTYLRPSLPSRNATCPSVSAKSVWSLPRPTLSPGCHLVPRWRTMMLPARTVSLPNFFTPRRLLSLSRPLRDEPPAFLCAMSTYFAFGLFLGPPLAGAAFFVDGVFASALAGAAFLAPGFEALPASEFAGAGFAVGCPATSLDAW